MLKNEKLRADYDRIGRLKGKVSSSKAATTAESKYGTSSTSTVNSPRSSVNTGRTTPSRDESNDEDQGDTLLDIAADLWKDVQANGAATILEDLLTFLDTSEMTSGKKQTFYDDLKGEAELNLVLATLKERAIDLGREIGIKDKVYLTLKNRSGPRSAKDIEDLLSAIESIKGMQARLREINVSTTIILLSLCLSCFSHSLFK